MLAARFLTDALKKKPGGQAESSWVASTIPNIFLALKIEKNLERKPIKLIEIKENPFSKAPGMV